MNDTVYFGQCDNPDSFDELFTDEKGNPWFFRLTMEDDQFVLEDTCGRYLPMEYEFAKALGTAVFIVNETCAAATAADNLYKSRIAQLEAIVEHMNETN